MLTIKNRFRGFLPIIVDVETSGFDPKTNAMLEIAAFSVKYDEAGILSPEFVLHEHIVPFPGAILDPSALAFTGIVPDHPFRFAKSEFEVLTELFKLVQNLLKQTECHKAVLVGHNANFDLSFLMAAIARCHIKRNPFHLFTIFDTATLSALALKQTILARACHAADIDFDAKQAHSAIYDAERTAKLFCWIVNKWDVCAAGV